LERWIQGPSPGPSDGEGSPDEGVLDPTLLEQLRDLGPAEDGGDLFSHLVEQFLEQSRTRLDELRQAAGGGDLQALVRASHTQRGSSAVMGARALASACAALESASERADLRAARDLLPEVEAELERATAALRFEARPRSGD
jgi:HPt (histidine-containing phosphotransfer) domain-containing protein